MCKTVRYRESFISAILHNSSAIRAPSFDFSRLARSLSRSRFFLSFFFIFTNQLTRVGAARADTLQFSRISAHILMSPAGRLGSRAGKRKRWIITAFRASHRPGRSVGRRLPRALRLLYMHARVWQQRIQRVACEDTPVYYHSERPRRIHWSREPKRRWIFALTSFLIASGLYATQSR